MRELSKFIDEQKKYFKESVPTIVWDDDRWDVSHWIPNRGVDRYIIFQPIKSKLIKSRNICKIIPLEFSEFMKALAVYMHRSRKTGFMSVRNYVNELRRMYSLVLFIRGESAPSLLSNWHFEQLLRTRKEENYKNIYNSAANIKLIADLIDRLNICETKINFQHGLKSKHHHNSLKSNIVSNDNERDIDKLPSLEFFQAYAYCTNNPINENEEILLRTIDLLIALGQRGNEVTVIPYDCIIEKYNYTDSGEIINDGHGKPIMTYGLKYFSEKNFEPKIHYLSDIDWPFAKRAIDRLKILTKEARNVALFQEGNPDRIWEIKPDSIISDTEISKYLQFKTFLNLHTYLRRKGVYKVSSDADHDRNEKFSSNRFYNYRYYYRAGDIENVLKNDLPDHFDFRSKFDSKVETVLKTSEILSIRFNGAFQFKIRGSHLKKIFPHRTTLPEINGALGSKSVYQTIFERRNLTEKDGTRLGATSHSFRHWRNTIYQLTGMSDVQQALALGRNDISQNKYYQHETLKEKTENHRNFLRFNNNQEKITYLQKGIKNGTIKGSITNLYEKIRKEQSARDADEFLTIHANSLHITPFGGCTHDFSQNPCLKHLQCWNGCSHLHRTGTENETRRLTELLGSLEKLKEKQAKELQEGSVWTSDLNSKISNLRKVLDNDTIDNSKKPYQVFPDSQYMQNIGKDKTSSTTDD
ncbi:hypothetical protein SAMN04488029_0132 [Reichenbachiella faecimaris]|uniref:Uncharacterized protein n=1 Tax=Reichenbachiella faecimaris TaxID=692418 RepID=A0A1W2G546_REIFA|nr:hypothetical protein [Reichenbachiella faecimaris]SMD31795.1 hypothetical protein SAMN04488029_0132 [Reichenbachiella faecimaris]